MTRDEVKELFARRQRCWDARDPVGLAATHAPNGTIISPMLGRPQGREAIADSYIALFRVFSDWQYTGEELLIDGDRVAQPFTVTATHTGEFLGLAPTGRRFKVDGVLMITLGDGLVQHERRSYDFTGLLIQVGVLKSKPAV
jgi:uncharacterized protein (TIGR02246 family)